MEDFGGSKINSSYSQICFMYFYPGSSSIFFWEDVEDFAQRCFMVKNMVSPMLLGKNSSILSLPPRNISGFPKVFRIMVTTVPPWSFFPSCVQDTSLPVFVSGPFADDTAIGWSRRCLAGHGQDCTTLVQGIGFIEPPDYLTTYHHKVCKPSAVSQL